ncbi:hypothetical protein SDC9_211003 [bioreactor metagenome]|uniref:Uncharacterized protein n=1 Tax=bioreactor metagenome TaxID=1076179 RepID=A0A645JII9_9ZZZZ
MILEALGNRCLDRALFGDRSLPLGTGHVVLILRNGDGGEDADDGNHDHQFDQGETLLNASDLTLHVVLLWGWSARMRPGWLYTFKERASLFEEISGRFPGFARTNFVRSDQKRQSRLTKNVSPT